MSAALWLFDDGSQGANKLADVLAASAPVHRTRASVSVPEVPPAACSCVLLPLGSVDGGLEYLRRLRERRYSGPVVFYADAPRPEVIRSVLNHGGQDVIDPDTDSAAVIFRAIAQAPARLESFREARKGVENRRAWVVDRFSEAQSIALVGSWEVDVHSWTAEWSPELRRIVGIEQREPPPGVEGYVAHVHPDDRLRVQADLMGLFLRGRMFDSTHRIVRRDGKERHVEARGRCELHADGKVRRAYGTVHDVTELRRMEEALRRERDFKTALLGAIRDGYTCTHMGVLVDVNDEFLRMTGYRRDELIGKTRPFPYWPQEERERLTSATSSLAGRGSSDIEAVLQTKDGRKFDALLSSRPARGENGEIVGFVTTIRDISQVKHRERALDRAANEDGLTGLLTRRAFDACLAREHQRVLGGNHKASLVVLDIDKYKNVNDTFGHPVGDAVLKEVADRLRSVVRGHDVVGRMGGDEIGWIVSGLDLPEAAKVCERLRMTIATKPFQTAGHLTVSVGVASLANVPKAEDAYLLADRALYGAKRGGRNRVGLADGSPVALAA